MAKTTRKNDQADEAPAKKRARKSTTADAGTTSEKAPKTRAKASGDGQPKKAPAGKGRSKKGGAGGPSREDIERRAYEIYQRRGGKHGLHDDDWYQAEKELREQG